ncbi:hypothetical protein RSO01_47600 [Reyranella soli]|uniref:Uncharacterized protein n=1 Tax=Reyranella soli TaxID=1230389 RepID=A0A512NF79_9HYPH|nr:hypothetical protein RSO01_47600 [Reyranella soli]
MSRRRSGIPESVPNGRYDVAAQGLPASRETQASGPNLSSASVSNAWDASWALLLKQVGFHVLETFSAPITGRDGTDKFIQGRSDFEEAVKRLVASIRWPVCPLPSDIARVRAIVKAVASTPANVLVGRLGRAWPSGFHRASRTSLARPAMNIGCVPTVGTRM